MNKKEAKLLTKQLKEGFMDLYRKSSEMQSELIHDLLDAARGDDHFFAKVIPILESHNNRLAQLNQKLEDEELSNRLKNVTDPAEMDAVLDADARRNLTQKEYDKLYGGK